MKKARWITTLAVVAAAGAALSTPAQAGTLDTSAEALTVARAIASDPAIVTGAEWVSQPPTPGATALGSGSLAGMPSGPGAAWGLLTTGDATLATQPNDSGSSGRSNGGGAVRGDTDRDVVVLRVDLAVPSTANCLLGLDFRFASEEYSEYVGSEYNDAFIAEVDQSNWTTSGSQINAPNNFAFDPQGNPISVNAAGATSMSAAEAAGTTYDGATPLLTAATPISPGAHSLYLSIFDQGDNVYDSAVLLDNLRIGSVANPATDCVPGAQPVGDFDRDADGLSDRWETSGAVGPTGNPTYDLPAMGARPDRKDLFLYVRATRDAPLSLAARQILTSAFARAPVTNPDGSTGITVHFVDGPPLSYDTADGWIIDSPFGPIADLRKVWDTWVAASPQGPSVFHFVASTTVKGQASVTGRASLPGQVVWLRNCGPRRPGQGSCQTDAVSQAANLMHEIGHNLWLRHGGGDDINRKPNYPSVMNYLFSYTGMSGIGLSYSSWGEETFYTLDENSLAEQDGVLVKNASFSPNARTAYVCAGQGNRGAIPIPFRTPVNWNCRANIEGGRLRADINNDGSFDQLKPFNDWANISLTNNFSNVGVPLVEYREGGPQF